MPRSVLAGQRWMIELEMRAPIAPEHTFQKYSKVLTERLCELRYREWGCR
jgi:hypothetical protein